MDTKISPIKRRKRGVILTQAGLKRFQTAKEAAEYAQNEGQRYTLEALSELTTVSVDTLTKVLGCELRVDKQTLKCCFQAFGLSLKPTDYYKPGSTAAKAAKTPTQSVRGFQPAPPGGQLSIESPLYIQRPKAEAESYQAIARPGALIRIRGAQRTGKTSMMARLSQQAKQQGYQPVAISFQLADKPVLQNLDRLLKWFCASVGMGMGCQPDLETYWDSLFGSKVSCQIYFEQYLLPAAERPIVLILDDVERLFRYVDVADEFFGLLRTWYENAKTNSTWKQIRIVIAQASEVYIPLNINKSPFNVGTAIPLPPFTAKDVQTLAIAYGLDWSTQSAEALCNLVAGQPYLIHLAVDRVWRNKIELSQVLDNPIGCHIFSSYLQHQLDKVKQQPQLAIALKQAIAPQSAAPTAVTDMYQLQSMGLIVLADKGPQLACDLFTHYFSTHFS